jgi:hypothetical protein
VLWFVAVVSFFGTVIVAWQSLLGKIFVMVLLCPSHDLLLDLASALTVSGGFCPAFTV